MRPADVIYALASDRRLSWEPGPGNTERAAWRAWIAIVETLKPGHVKQPMSPLEVQRARVVLAALAGALDRAERAHPAHFCDVQDIAVDRPTGDDDEDEFGVGANSRSKTR